MTGAECFTCQGTGVGHYFTPPTGGNYSAPCHVCKGRGELGGGRPEPAPRPATMRAHDGREILRHDDAVCICHYLSRHAESTCTCECHAPEEVMPDALTTGDAHDTEGVKRE